MVGEGVGGGVVLEGGGRERGTTRVRRGRERGGGGGEEKRLRVEKMIKRGRKNLQFNRMRVRLADRLTHLCDGLEMDTVTLLSSLLSLLCS